MNKLIQGVTDLSYLDGDDHGGNKVSRNEPEGRNMDTYDSNDDVYG